MFWAGFDLPGPPLDVSPVAFPHGQLATVIGLQLRGVDHPKATTGLHREGDDEVTRLGHLAHTRPGTAVPDVCIVNMHALYVSIPVSVPRDAGLHLQYSRTLFCTTNQPEVAA